jgi:hypothetical protein
MIKWETSATTHQGPHRSILIKIPGHSLGVVHLDEDFSNVDFGSCMEYTNDVSANRRPNLRNYEMLLRIYGGVVADQRIR